MQLMGREAERAYFCPLNQYPPLKVYDKSLFLIVFLSNGAVAQNQAKLLPSAVAEPKEARGPPTDLLVPPPPPPPPSGQKTPDYLIDILTFYRQVFSIHFFSFNRFFSFPHGVCCDVKPGFVPCVQGHC